MQRINVDLPEPDSPIMISSSPLMHLKRCIVDADNASGLLKFGGIDDAAGFFQHAVRIIAKNHVDRFAADNGFF